MRRSGACDQASGRQPQPQKLAELRRVLDGAGLSGLTLLSLGDVAAA